MKVFTGKVVSIKMEKTATVAVERVVVHPKYKKRFRRTRKYHVHDELGAKIGDEVKFTASKPYSKLKKWKIIKVTRDGKQARREKKVSSSQSLSSSRTKKGGRTRKDQRKSAKKSV